MFEPNPDSTVDELRIENAARRLTGRTWRVGDTVKSRFVKKVNPDARYKVLYWHDRRSGMLSVLAADGKEQKRYAHNLILTCPGTGGWLK